MTPVVTSNVLDPNCDPYQSLSAERVAEMCALLDDLGYPLAERYVFRVEADLVDCPMLRVAWMTRDALAAIPDKCVADGDFDVIDYCDLSEVAARDLPEWWQPEVLNGAA